MIRVYVLHNILTIEWFVNLGIVNSSRFFFINDNDYLKHNDPENDAFRNNICSDCEFDSTCHCVLTIKLV